MRQKTLNLPHDSENFTSYGNENTTSTIWPDLLLTCVQQVADDINMTDYDANSLLSLFSSYSDQSTDSELFYPTAGDDNNTLVIAGLLTECLNDRLPPDRPYLLPWWQQLTWTLAFGAMLIIAVGGNAIVMWIVIGESM